MTEPDFRHLSPNLTHAMNALGLNIKSFAAYLHIDRPYLSKLLNQRIVLKSKTKTLQQIATALKVSTNDLIYSPSYFTNAFAKAQGRTFSSIETCSNEHQHVILHCVNQYRSSWQEQFDRHKGQYILYSHLLYKDASITKKTIVISMLDINEICKEGIKFSLINPYPTTAKKYNYYQYTGVMYPVSEYLYFFGEQQSNYYEIIFMITDSSPEPIPQFLDGCITAIAVRRGNKMIGQSPIVLEHQVEPIRDWREVMDTKLGWFDEDDVPPNVLARL